MQAGDAGEVEPQRRAVALQALAQHELGGREVDVTAQPITSPSSSTFAARAPDVASCSRCRPKRSASRSHASTPRTLLPAASSSGLNSPMPNCPGLTASTPPDTPLLAGRPTRSIHAPAASYMPHMAIIDSTCCAVSSRTTCAPLTGWRPALASVAAIIARSAAVTSSEHCRK